MDSIKKRIEVVAAGNGGQIMPNNWPESGQ